MRSWVFSSSGVLCFLSLFAVNPDAGEKLPLPAQISLENLFCVKLGWVANTCNVTEHFYSLFTSSHLKVDERKKMCVFASSIAHCLWEKEFIVQLTDGCCVDKAWWGNVPGQDLRPPQFLFPHSTIGC